MKFTEYFPHSLLPEEDLERWFSPMDRTLRRELKSKFTEYWFDTTSLKDFINLKIKYLNGYFHFVVPKDRVKIHLQEFCFMDYPTCILTNYNSINLLKNQTRPIINLARASENLVEEKILANIDLQEL